MKGLRRSLRDAYLRFFARSLACNESRAELVGLARGTRLETADFEALRAADLALPYDLGAATPGESGGRARPSVVISARFRSGSTMLWNAFRVLDGCTAYYEPFNERRWFDPALRGEGVDDSHRGVADYWQEYRGLERLGECFDEAWCTRRLLMTERDADPRMARYVDTLIEAAAGLPVLQFNRIDFRLAWFRHRYPRAKLVHLYRDPREQWCSTLTFGPGFPTDGATADFDPADGFYLRAWLRDLRFAFPFLDPDAREHPYQMFFALWWLSLLYGRRHCDASIRYEDLVERPAEVLAGLFELVGLPPEAVAAAAATVGTPRSESRAASYAPLEWFAEQEAAAAARLREFLGV